MQFRNCAPFENGGKGKSVIFGADICKIVISQIF